MIGREEQELAVVPLQQQDAPDVADVLSEAFFDYPVMRFVLGTAGNYDERLPDLVAVFVAARALRNDPMFGVRDGTRLIAAMTMSNPAEPSHPDFDTMREAAWLRLGHGVEQRYAQCVATWESLASNKPQLHVNMIGVRAAYQGRGFARRMLAEAHRLCEESEVAEGVSLTTEQARNVDFYRHHGYEVIGHAQIAEGVSTWSFFRERAV